MVSPRLWAPSARWLAALLLGCNGQGYVVDTTLLGASSPPSPTSPPATQVSPNTGSGGTGSTGGSGAGTGGNSAGGGTETGKSSCASTADTFDNFAKAAIATNCASCHSGEWDTVAEASAKAASLRGQIAGGLMPPAGNLDATVKSRLLVWLNCPTPLP